MRIFCLTSIQLSKEVPESFVKPFPYKKYAEENMSFAKEMKRTFENIKNKSEFCENYNLTEICIGFIGAYEKAFQKRVFVMNIYRDDIGLIFVRMVRSMVHYKEFQNNVLEINIPFREFYCGDDIYNLTIRIRNIKNTVIKGIISEEEERIYRNFAYQINQYQPKDREAAFDVLPFHLPKQTRDSALRTKLSDFRKLIVLLCHHVTGSFKNVPETKRYNQKIKCLLMQRNEWKLDAPRKGEAPKSAKNYRFCRHLTWHDANINDFDNDDIEANYIETILFESVKLYAFPGTLHPCLTEHEYFILKSLTLTKCNLTAFSADFGNLLVPSLTYLDLSYNKITFITQHIFRLEKLETIIIKNNLELNENGIPWKYLPKSITKLDLRETGITVIPEDIRKLEFLKYFYVHSNVLKYISWDAFSRTITHLDVKGGGIEINEIDLQDKCSLTELSIQNAGIQEINCCNLPSTLKGLFLANNKLRYFDTQNALPYLLELNLNNNCLDFINWKNLPSPLGNLYFKENHIKAITDISHLTKLYEIVGVSNQIEYISEDIQNLRKLTILELEDNRISALPESFGLLNSLRELNLSCNKLNIAERNLEEVLWKRLPKNLEQLWLNENNLVSLPCILKNIQIPHLHVENCNIYHICPFLYANPNRKTCLLNIDTNPGPSNLPFMPQQIYHPSTINQKLEATFTNSFFENSFTLIKKMKKRSSDLKKFVITSNFPTKSKKPFYSFRPYIGNQMSPVACKCCANCGEETYNGLIEQLMIMDYDLNLELLLPIQKRISKKGKVEALLMDGEKDIKSYPPGKWKTTVVTRLCDYCIQKIKEKVEKSNKEFEDANTNPTDDKQLNPPNKIRYPGFVDPSLMINQAIVAVNDVPQNINVSNNAAPPLQTTAAADAQNLQSYENQEQHLNVPYHPSSQTKFLNNQYNFTETEFQQHFQQPNQQIPMNPNYEPVETHFHYQDAFANQQHQNQNYSGPPPENNIQEFYCYPSQNFYNFNQQNEEFLSADFTVPFNDFSNPPQQQFREFHENEIYDTANATSEHPTTNNDVGVEENKSEKHFWEFMMLE